MNFYALIAYFVMLLFDLAIIAGTAYLVGWQDWNPWWFALTLLFVGHSGFRFCIPRRSKAP